MKPEDFMKIAIKEAEKAKKEGNLPFGAIIVKSGEVIAKGRCEEFTLNDVTAHAEMNAIRKANKKVGRDLSDCQIYCTSEPCNMCASAIFQANISEIFIGTSRHELPHIYRQRKIRINNIANDLSYTPKIVWGIMLKENLAVFEGIKLR